MGTAEQILPTPFHLVYRSVLTADKEDQNPKINLGRCVRMKSPECSCCGYLYDLYSLDLHGT